jgi:valyl-tRNA synthetase
MADATRKPVAQTVLAFVLDRVLRLLHPFVPFITEGIYDKLREVAPNRGLAPLAPASEASALAVAPWPERLDDLLDPQTEECIRIVQEVVRAIRDIRNKYSKAPSEKLAASAQAPRAACDTLNTHPELVCQLAGLVSFEVAEDAVKPSNAAAAIVVDIQIYVHNVIDPKAERERLEKQRAEIDKAKLGVERKLANENFVAKAKPEVVAQARERLAQFQEQLRAVKTLRAELDG